MKTKTRVTITIDNKVLKRARAIMGLTDFGSLSHMIEIVLKRYVEEFKGGKKKQTKGVQN